VRRFADGGAEGAAEESGRKFQRAGELADRQLGIKSCARRRDPL
jgi:hypothetical protein